MHYSIKISGCLDGFRAIAHMKILQKDFSYPIFKSKRVTNSVTAGEEVILRIPEGKNQSTLLRKIKETGARAELAEQRRVRPSLKPKHGRY